MTIASLQLGRAQRALREVALALHSRDLEDLLARDYSGRVEGYRDPLHNQIGLYAFEQEALDRFFPKPPARIFVPGVGGGREGIALLSAGYAVDAIEPVRALATLAERTLRGSTGFRIRAVSLQDWCRGPAVDRYDGILTGWGMWTSMLWEAERIAALEAFRAACPSGPVLLSFWPQTPEPVPANGPAGPPELLPAPQGRLQHWIRAGIRERLLGKARLERGTDWETGLFVHRVSEAELTAEAKRTGYRVAHFERDPAEYPNAVLLPRDTTPE